MATVNLPKMRPVPEGATDEDRRRMYNEYKAELIKLNPNSFNDDGTVKTVWQRIFGLFR